MDVVTNTLSLAGDLLTVVWVLFTIGVGYWLYFKGSAS